MWNGFVQCDVTRKETVLKPKLIRGYENVSIIYDDGSRKTKQVHRLILETFNEVEKMNTLQVNHINGIKSDNRLCNLEWVTNKENVEHSIRMGLWKPKEQSGELNAMAKLTAENVIYILENQNKYSIKYFAELYNVSSRTIRNIKNGKTWKHIPR